MTNTPLMEKRINESGYKRSYIAKCLDITPYALAMKINNKSEFKQSEIDILCELLGVDVDERMAIFFAKKVEYSSTLGKEDPSERNEQREQ